MTYLHNIGLYFLMIKEMFRKPTKWSVMKPLILKDIEKKESTELSNIENNVPEKKRLALNIKKSQGVFIFNNRTFGTLDLAIEYAEKNGILNL